MKELCQLAVEEPPSQVILKDLFEYFDKKQLGFITMKD